MTDAERILAEVYASLPTVACQRKCGQSCGPIMVYPVERRRMERAVWPLAPTIDPTSLTCGYYDAVANACRVHADRPLICRLFGAVLDHRLVCPFGCQPDRWLTNQEVAVLRAKLAALEGEVDFLPVADA